MTSWIAPYSRISKQIRFRSALIATVGLTIILAGCQSTDFNDTKTKAMIEVSPVHLDSEQVVLSQGHVDCGVANELWDAVSQVSDNRSTARLLPNGRSLNFSDDVAYDQEFHGAPTIQVRGDFPLEVSEIVSTVDEGKDSKLVRARLGVRIAHGCFPGILMIMGVAKGKLSTDAPAAIRFKLLEDGWHLDGFVH